MDDKKSCDVYRDRLWKVFASRNVPAVWARFEDVTTFRGFLAALDEMPEVEESLREKAY